MKVSFLVTFYNQKSYVQQALNSILAIKKTFDWEILVGDDGSTDGTVEAVQEYVSKYPEHIFLHVMPRDHGIKYNPMIRASKNRLNLLDHASGDYFCFLDGDDHYCDTEFVEQALNVYKNTPHISAVAFGFKRFNDTNNSEEQEFLPPFEGYITKKAFLITFYTHVGSCVLRLVKDKARIDYIKSLGIYDDNTIVISNLYYGDMYCIPKTVYAYRETANSIMTSMSTSTEEDALNAQGYDIDVKLIDKPHQKDVLWRNRKFIINLYRNKKKLVQELGQEKHSRYLAECREIEDSLTYKIFTYDELNKKDRLSVDWLVFRLLFLMKMESLKQAVHNTIHRIIRNLKKPVKWMLKMLRNKNA